MRKKHMEELYVRLADHPSRRVCCEVAKAKMEQREPSQGVDVTT